MLENYRGVYKEIFPAVDKKIKYLQNWFKTRNKNTIEMLESVVILTILEK
jgi:hypothetical protein